MEPDLRRCTERRAGRTARGAAVVTLLVGLIHAAPATAQIRSLEMRVADMTSVLYARGVQESIKGLQEVARVDVDLASRRVTVEAADGKSLSIKQVKERVTQAGFRIEGALDLRAVGRFSVGPRRRLTFRIEETSHVYQVLENYGTLTLFRNHPGLKGRFLVGFRLHDNPTWKRTAIALTSVTPWTAPAAPQ
jgi:copper chaperone CopZ